MKHKPVLLEEILHLFKTPPLQMLDCTLGRAGHTKALLEKFKDSNALGLDQDEEAIDYAKSLDLFKKGRLKLQKQNFHDVGSIKGSFDFILMDLGPSSPQLDNKERGFSFLEKGPLDMRMDLSNKLKASDIINSWSKKDLIGLFKTYGEVRSPYKVVDAIFERRRKKKFEDTLDLSQIIKENSFSRSHHPATLYFLALRIFVNNELEGLKKALPSYIDLLNEKGLLAVISFHSLEDRIVKQAFKKFVLDKKGNLFNKKVIRASLKEVKDNVRSRSAKLRVFEKSSL